MHIAYFTRDEVNSHLAAEIAGPFGASLETLQPEAVRGDRQFDAALYDLDCVAPEGRAALLDELLSGRPNCPRAVHGYCQTEEQALAIRLSGVAVAQRLEPDLIRTLCEATHLERMSVPADDSLPDYTWIGL
jgi:hypothetical protein